MAAQFRLARSGAAGAIIAEADAAGTIVQWERGLHVLKLAEAAFARVGSLLVDLEAQRRKEQEPEVSEALGRKLDAYRAELAGLRRQSKGVLDTATWTRVDVEVQALIGQLRKAVAETKLDALLNEI